MRLRLRGVAAAMLLLLGALSRPASAQRASDRLARGLRHYQNLEYDSAAIVLRSALAQAGPTSLDDAQRVRALSYLGATELFGGRRDSAVAAFGRLLLLDPRYRIDQLVFPPEVTGLFQQVRLTIHAAALVAPALTRLGSAGDRLVAWLYVTSFHPVDVVVTRENGALLGALYQGGVGDSAQIEWDGRASDGLRVGSGRYLIRADSRDAAGRIVRSVAVPLDVTEVETDTLPAPLPLPDSSFKPENMPGGNGLGPLLTGLGAAAAVVALPSMVGGGTAGMGDRFVVAGALGIAGIISFPLQRRPRVLAENVAANQALRLSWQRLADSVRAENVARRRNAVVIIRAGGWAPVAGAARGGSAAP